MYTAVQQYNHYGFVAENSMKYVPPDGFFGTQILHNSISAGKPPGLRCG